MMSEPTAVTEERPGKPPEGPGSDVRVAGAPAPEDLVSVEMLLEDVSIDGLCGVY